MSSARSWPARFPTGRSVTLPQLSHFGPMEDPAAVAAEIRAFAGSLRTVLT